MRKLILMLILSISAFGYTQDTLEHIDAQRPTLTESNSIIGTEILQFENGLDYFGKSRTFGYGTFVRGSLNSVVELRLLTDYTKINNVGIKFSFLKPENSNIGLGASFVYAHALDGNNNDIRLALTRDCKHFSLTYNFGHNGSIYNILYVGTHIKHRVSGFVEYYNDKYINRLHGGIMYFPNKDIQLDINGGWIDKTGWYTGIGFSFRFR
jgi:hypothetical protein